MMNSFCSLFIVPNSEFKNMAVIRTRKDSDTSGDAPSGASESTPVVPPDRTKSVVKSAPVVNRPAPRTAGRAQMPGGAPLANSGDSRSFVRDTLAELKRVIWPSKDDVVAGTVVTIGLLMFFSIYIFGLDYLAEHFFKALGFYN